MLNKKTKPLFTIIITVIFLLFSFFLPLELRIYFLLLLYLFIAKNILKRFFINLKKGHFFNENNLMALASLGAILIGEVEEAIAVNLFYNIGLYFEKLALNNSRKSLASLFAYKNTKVRLISDNKYLEKDPQEVEIGAIYELRPGEKVPLDGVIIEGETSVDTANITGESLPLYCQKNSKIISGYLNIDGVVKVKVLHKEEDSAMSKIIALVEEAITKKSKTETFINRFASIYTPVIILSAILMIILPPLLFKGDLLTWFHRSLNFLVVSCPCALVLSLPLAFFGAISSASKKGILLKSSIILEKINKSKLIAFDKTGTLTDGNLKIVKIVSTINEKEALDLAASLENYSNHPLASAFAKGPYTINDIKEISGMGLLGSYNKKEIALGNEKLLTFLKLSTTIKADLYLALNKEIVAYFYLQDEIKISAYSVLKRLKSLGFKKLTVLSGDNATKTNYLKEKLLLDEVYHSLLPLDKLKHIENLKKEGILTYVGDGLNDAPSLMASDIGIGMGKRGSDLALEVADVVIVDDKLEKICVLFKLAKKTMIIVKENIILSLSIKFIILVLSVFGYANMWLAVFGDVGVTLLCLANSFRLYYVKK